MKSDMLEVNFKSKVNGVIEEVAGGGKDDTAAEEFSEGEMINEVKTFLISYLSIRKLIIRTTDKQWARLKDSFCNQKSGG